MYLNNDQDFQVQVLYVVGLWTRKGSVGAEVDFSFFDENGQKQIRSRLIEFGDLLSGRINEFLNAELKKKLKEQEKITEIVETEVADARSDMNWEGGPS